MSREVEFRIGENVLRGNLDVPENASTLVIFSHGSGSSRFSVRNRLVASKLNHEGIATLLTDLLTETEDRIYENRFNIDLLTDRLVEVTIKASEMKELKDLAIGYFGASTGAASALGASTRLEHLIEAVVSRGGRPDLAKSALLEVKAPVLLIVGSRDTDVIMLNEQAYGMMFCEKEMKIIDGAGHLFEEPGKLEEVADMAIDWFIKHLHHHVVVK